MKVIRKWKQVYLETYDGQILGIETQKYPVEAQDRHILELRLRPGWFWVEDWHGHSIANGTEVKRVRKMYETRETFWDKVKRRL